MKLIEQISDENGLPIIRFYDGIDFNMISNHPVNGSDGFLFFFVDNWVIEKKIYERENKINSILEDEYKPPVEDTYKIENPYISIYQTNGNTNDIYQTIRKKVITEDYVPHRYDQYEPHIS